MDEIDRSIAERASQQLGLVSRTDCARLGLSTRMLRRRVGTGRLYPVGNQVLRLAGTPTSWEGNVLAACLETNGVASHRTAAALHGLEGFASSPPGFVEVTVLRGRNHRTPLAAVHTTTNLPAADLVRVGPVPATSIARTILGLAALTPAVAPDRLAATVGAAIREGRASDRWLWWRLEQLRCRGRNGVAALEAILAERAGLGRTESWLEHRTLEVLRDGGLPLPECQRRVTQNGTFAARVDFLYPHEAVVIEVDGHGGHSTKAQRRRDAERHVHRPHPPPWLRPPSAVTAIGPADPGRLPPAVLHLRRRRRPSRPRVLRGGRRPVHRCSRFLWPMTTVSVAICHKNRTTPGAGA
jgi:hypothetical protein